MSRVMMAIGAAALCAAVSGCAAGRDSGDGARGAGAGSGVLARSAMVGFLATAKPDECRAFFGRTLGLALLHEDAQALVFATRDGSLRVQKGATITPVARTLLGWEVADIGAAVAELGARGVMFERYDFLEDRQDESGVWTAGNGDRVAWFRDPDGNIISLQQLAR